MNILTFDTLPSTNKYCELLNLDKVEEFTIYYTKEQTAGIGQKGNHWESAPNENLTFSIILKPHFLAFEDQFQLTKILSLGVGDYLYAALPQHDIAIKWPNDIYVDGKKICGILTTNRVNHGVLSSSICGIGFNVNQSHFPDWIPNPTSLALLSQREYNLIEVLEGILDGIKHWYDHLCNHEWDQIDATYLSRLYRLDQWADYQYLGNPITAKILGVNRFGHLQIETQQGNHYSCALKEIVFL